MLEVSLLAVGTVRQKRNKSSNVGGVAFMRRYGLEIA